MSAVILTIDDDCDLCSLLRDMFQNNGLQVLVAHDGVRGLELLRRYNPDLVLLDIMMPTMDGWEVCRRIREISNVPIMILSGRLDESDKVRGLELGADDYVTKPFNTAEVVARVKALLRRSGPPVVSDVLHVDDWLEIDRARGRVTVDGRAVDLTPIELKLLYCFLDQPGVILTSQHLLTHVWGWEYADETDYLKVYVHQLRQKIEPNPKEPRYILTERGLGYRFQAPSRS